MPWRKGPFHVHGIHIDTWRGAPTGSGIGCCPTSALQGRYVLDVAAAAVTTSGAWWAKGETGVGIDPSPLFLCQFEAIRHFAGNDQRAHLLPLGIQELPDLRAFDTVFSMGCSITTSPHRGIEQLRNQLKDDGELVLEPGGRRRRNQVLMPDRYGKRCATSGSSLSAALTRWVERAADSPMRIVDENKTSTDEQRRTDWMINESLSDYLDQQSRTHGRRIPGTQTCRTRSPERPKTEADGGCGSYTDPIPGSTVKWE